MIEGSTANILPQLEIPLPLFIYLFFLRESQKIKAWKYTA